MRAPKGKPSWLTKLEQRKLKLQQEAASKSLESATSLVDGEKLPIWSNRKSRAVEKVLTAPAQTPYTHFAITLTRSTRGLEKKRKDVVASLGLKKTHQTVIKPITAAIAGNVLVAKEVLKVRNLSSPQEALVSRRPTKGFTVVGSLDGSVEISYERPRMVFSKGRVVPFDQFTGAMYTTKGVVYYKPPQN